MTNATMTTTMTIQEAKRFLRKRDFIVKDVSGSNSFGYDFAIYKSEIVTEPIVYTCRVGDAIVKSFSVYEPETINRIGRKGAVRVVFNRADVEALIDG